MTAILLNPIGMARSSPRIHSRMGRKLVRPAALTAKAGSAFKVNRASGRPDALFIRYL